MDIPGVAGVVEMLLVMVVIVGVVLLALGLLRLVLVWGVRHNYWRDFYL